MSPDTIAILLGRKGSKGLPGKNTMTILGRPISHYSILAALNSNYVSDIYLSTDDQDLLLEAEKFQLHTIVRPAELCSDEALFEDALMHGYKEATKSRGNKPDLVVVLMCNVITIDNILIDSAIEALNSDPLADSAVTVTKLNMYSPLRARKRSNKGYLQPFVPFEVLGNPDTLSCDRDSQGDVYFADMSHSVSRSRAMDNIENGLLPQRWMGQNILPVYNSFGCDIDAPWQVDASVHWLLEKGFTEGRTPYDN